MSAEKNVEVGSTDLSKSSTNGETEHIEVIRTISRVENPNYHEKNGLRTEGDGVDHAHYNSVRPKAYFCIDNQFLINSRALLALS
jgi:hypothetical protein